MHERSKGSALIGLLLSVLIIGLLYAAYSRTLGGTDSEKSDARENSAVSADAGPDAARVLDNVRKIDKKAKETQKSIESLLK